MIEEADFVVALQDALQSGDLLPPAALLNTIASLDPPVNALTNNDAANEAFDALYADFAFLRTYGVISGPPPSDTSSRWASLLRWFLAEAQGWQADLDPDRRTLIALFIVAAAHDRERAFWKHVPLEFADNPRLIETLQTFIEKCSVAFGTRGLGPAPIWEWEAVKAFEEADPRGDWTKIAPLLRPFNHQLWPSILQRQALQWLARVDIKRAVSAVTSTSQTIVAIQIAAALSVEHRLGVALATANSYIEFGGLYQTLVLENLSSLSQAEEALLVNLLIKIAGNEERWLGCMRSFNDYPNRYPILQRPLGRALAHVADNAIDAYINSIDVYPMPANDRDLSRTQVAVCLREFSEHASHKRRALLWKAAHSRWSQWRFDQANKGSHLFHICKSELDYPVVAYARECMNDTERTAAIDTLMKNLGAIENQWHASINDVRTEWNRLLSLYQLYANANNALTSGVDWFPNRVYPIVDPSKDIYLALRFGYTFTASQSKMALHQRARNKIAQ